MEFNRIEDVIHSITDSGKPTLQSKFVAWAFSFIRVCGDKSALKRLVEYGLLFAGSINEARKDKEVNLTDYEFEESTKQMILDFVEFTPDERKELLLNVYTKLNEIIGQEITNIKNNKDGK